MPYALVPLSMLEPSFSNLLENVFCRNNGDSLNRLSVHLQDVCVMAADILENAEPLLEWLPVTRCDNELKSVPGHREHFFSNSPVQRTVRSVSVEMVTLVCTIAQSSEIARYRVENAHAVSALTCTCRGLAGMEPWAKS